MRIFNTDAEFFDIGAPRDYLETAITLARREVAALAAACIAGVDRVFTRGTTPGEVASFLVHRLVERKASIVGIDSFTPDDAPLAQHGECEQEEQRGERVQHLGGHVDRVPVLQRPAPAATPFTAASTGFSIVRSARMRVL